MHIKIGPEVNLLELAKIPNELKDYIGAVAQEHDGNGNQWLALRDVDGVTGGWDVMICFVPSTGGESREVAHFYSKQDAFARAERDPSLKDVAKMLLKGKAGGVALSWAGTFMGLMITCDERGDAKFPAIEIPLFPQT